MATDTPAAACPVADLSDSIGIILADVLVSNVFYGVACLQMVIYFTRYPKDSLIQKGVVMFVWLVNSGFQMLICAGVWQYLVSHFGDFGFLSNFHLPLPLATVIASIVSTIVQSFFVWRIWIFSRQQWIFPAVLMPAILVQPVLSIVYVIGSVRNPNLQDFARLNSITFAANSIAAGVDILLAICMVTLLAMGRTGFKKTDALLLRLMVITINTGIWTALFALFVVILSKAYPGKLTNTATYFSLCSLYTNTLLANLNSRHLVRDSAGTKVNTTSGTGTSSTPLRSVGFKPPAVNVFMETSTLSDNNADNMKRYRNETLV